MVNPLAILNKSFWEICQWPWNWCFYLFQSNGPGRWRSHLHLEGVEPSEKATLRWRRPAKVSSRGRGIKVGQRFRSRWDRNEVQQNSSFLVLKKFLSQIFQLKSFKKKLPKWNWSPLRFKASSPGVKMRMDYFKKNGWIRWPPSLFKESCHRHQTRLEPTRLSWLLDIPPARKLY